MTTKQTSNKILRIAAFMISGILVLLLCFHFWFINHAEQMIEELVNDQSNGKVKLKVEKFKFNWFSNKIELRNAVFSSRDTSTASIYYRFQVPRMKIEVREILPLIFEKRILIDSLHLTNPDISVTRLRSSKDSVSSQDTSLSIPQEMGRIYNSIQNALEVLNVSAFQIDNGKFSLINKTQADNKPVTITRLYLHLDNLRVDSVKKAEDQKILFSDNVALHTSNQDILFPDGRHRLSFKNFRINIVKKMVEFDSCTVVATKGDSAKSSFRIFFDKLLMTNIDFDTLYHSEVIKADSVYCINPRFRLDVDLEKRTGPAKPPKLNELIQQLTGDMQLAFVVVDNASFDINTMREGRPSSFTSDNNNFELQGLRIQKDAPKPLTVEKFVMAIRNYENFLKDSAYSIQFDSVFIYNNRISLSNFLFQELKQNKVVNSLRMPQFELQGLSWDKLILEQQLKADKVTLYSPVINYSIAANKKSSSKDVFDALAGIGNIMQLDKLHIVNGQVNLRFLNNTSLQLENASMEIEAQKLVHAKKITSINRAVNSLLFDKGILTTGNTSAILLNARLKGKENSIYTRSLTIKNNTATIVADNVSLSSLQADDQFNQFHLQDLQWSKASVVLQSANSNSSVATTNFALHNIVGKNTWVDIKDNQQTSRVWLNEISADELSSSAKPKKWLLKNFTASGNSFSYTADNKELSVEQFTIADQKYSALKNILYQNYTGSDSVYVKAPMISTVPNIQAMLQGNITAKEIIISQPVIRLNLNRNNTNAVKWPLIQLSKTTIIQPDLEFINTNEKGTSKLSWNPKEKNRSLAIDNLQSNSSDSLSADQIRFTLDDFSYVNTKGKKISSGKGLLQADLQQLLVKKNETGELDWQGQVKKLQADHFEIDSIGKKSGRLSLQTAQLHHLSLKAEWLLSLREIVKQNKAFRLSNVTGSYVDSQQTFKWHNLSYYKGSRLFNADSFSYQPKADKESFMATQQFQTDYLFAKTGAIQIGPLDIDRFATDSILYMGNVRVQNGYLSNYRDKRLKRQPGLVQALPGNLIRQIPVHLLIDTVQVSNANVDYEEMDDKRNIAGKVSVNRLNGIITRVRNYGFKETDSLHILATGYLQNELFTRLNVKEAYMDTAGGFTMHVEMGPADLAILNPILAPLAGAELKSGYADTLIMDVTGKEELAYGKMKMIYHDLRVRVLNKNEKKPSLGTHFLNGLVNTIVKNKNIDRTGTVFFQRLRDRSAINYLVKITLSGVANSVGIPAKKKQLRPYKKQLKKQLLSTPEKVKKD